MERTLGSKSNPSPPHSGRPPKRRRFSSSSHRRTLSEKSLVKPWSIGQRILVHCDHESKPRPATIRDYDSSRKTTQLWFETKEHHFENVDLLSLSSWDVPSPPRPLSKQLDFVPSTDWQPIIWRLGQRVLVRFDGKIGRGQHFAAFVDGYDPRSRRHHVNYGDTSEWVWATKQRVCAHDEKLDEHLERKLNAFRAKQCKIQAPPFEPAMYGLDESFVAKSRHIEAQRVRRQQRTARPCLKKPFSFTLKPSTNKKRKSGEENDSDCSTSSSSRSLLKVQRNQQRGQKNKAPPKKVVAMTRTKRKRTLKRVVHDDDIKTQSQRQDSEHGQHAKQNSESMKNERYPRTALICGQEWHRQFSARDKKYYWLLREWDSFGDVTDVPCKEWDPWRKNGEMAPWMERRQSWYRFTDPKEHCPYYYNYDTSKSTFERPDSFESESEIDCDSAVEQQL